MRLSLTICTLLDSETLARSLQHYLSGERYMLTRYQSPEEFLQFVEQEKQILDCLILEDSPDLLPLVNQLYAQGTLLPLVILKPDSQTTPNNSLTPPTSESANNQQSHENQETAITEAPKNPAKELTSGEGSFFYHTAAVYVYYSQLSHITHYIDEAIANFLKLSSVAPWCETHSDADTLPEEENVLIQQQRRLAEKLKERLGYLGVYYKRNPQNFFRNLPSAERQEFILNLKAGYRQIVLEYFVDNSNLNQKIDEFVNVAFFADISVTYIVEIHMELMDEISKQLKLEGRGDEILLDYRLTLIDVIAHLCEMYRRSLPKDT
ncbi:circadian clock protein KaiA [Aerosakkonemataceae cyanobacterium BLCC-F154]|uniref:Circadian clock oscillator protein KaiA n=1 Tax=Floridaenema fluviatile BLCC-F154 TaxID=3153640 RepID=A0ABV4YGC3_9CYAN